MSHGTNLSAGGAVLFTPGLDVNIISSTEMVKGRALVVRATIQSVPFVFINIYAPNQGSHRTDVFHQLRDVLQQCDQNQCVVMGGDWNCTIDPLVDRRGTSSHLTPCHR